MTFSESALDALARAPPHGTIHADRLAEESGRPEALRRARLLEDAHCLDAATRRPKTLRLPDHGFPRALNGILRTRPHLRPMLANSHLPVLAVLACEARPLDAAEIARKAGVSERTVRAVLNRFAHRGLLRRHDRGHQLADHVPELHHLGRLYCEHETQRRMARAPGAFPVAVRGTRTILESDEPVDDLEPTAYHRFELEGADVLAPRYQYALAMADEGTTLHDAYEDMLALSPPPRTQRAVETYLKGQEGVRG